MKNYHLYIITNKVNDKKYVGITKKGYQYRFNWHLDDARRHSPKQNNIVLYHAIRKHGSENFVVALLEEGDSWKHLCDLERAAIIKHNTFMGVKKSHGYNMTKGGDGVSGMTWKWSEEQKLDFKNRVVNTKEYRQKISDNNARYWFGKTVSDEKKAQISKKLKGVCGKKCIIDGVIYDSALTASKALSLHVETVRKRCRQKYKDYRFVAGYNDTCGTPRPCIIDDKRYESITAASKGLNLKTATIRKRLNDEELVDYNYVID